MELGMLDGVWTNHDAILTIILYNIVLLCKPNLQQQQSLRWYTYGRGVLYSHCGGEWKAACGYRKKGLLSIAWLYVQHAADTCICWTWFHARHRVWIYKASLVDAKFARALCELSASTLYVKTSIFGWIEYCTHLHIHQLYVDCSPNPCHWFSR